MYHTPYLVDLINQGSKIIPDFEIMVPERFIAPEQREHLYVPGSPTARISLVGKWLGSEDLWIRVLLSGKGCGCINSFVLIQLISCHHWPPPLVVHPFSSFIYAGVSVGPTLLALQGGGGRYHSGLPGSVYSIYTLRGGTFVGFGDPKWQFSKFPHIPVYDNYGGLPGGLQPNYAPGGRAFRGVWRCRCQSPPQWRRWDWALHWLLHYSLIKACIVCLLSPSQVTWWDQASSSPLSMPPTSWTSPMVLVRMQSSTLPSTCTTSSTWRSPTSWMTLFSWMAWAIWMRVSTTVGLLSQ